MISRARSSSSVDLIISSGRINGENRMHVTPLVRVLCIASVFALTGCVTVRDNPGHGHRDRPHDTHYEDYGPAPYGDHYRRGKFDLIWSPTLGVYEVAGFPEVYWHGGWYWSQGADYWARSAAPGPRRWSRVAPEHVPEPFRSWRQERRSRRDRRYHD